MHDLTRDPTADHTTKLHDMLTRKDNEKLQVIQDIRAITHYRHTIFCHGKIGAHHETVHDLRSWPVHDREDGCTQQNCSWPVHDWGTVVHRENVQDLRPTIWPVHIDHCYRRRIMKRSYLLWYTNPGIEPGFAHIPNGLFRSTRSSIGAKGIVSQSAIVMIFTSRSKDRRQAQKESCHNLYFL